MQNNQQIILEEDFEHYEPTEQEIKDYATFLGMNLEQDQDLLWIAQQGLKAPLPEEWKACQTQEGELYYFNFKNGLSQWDHPCDQLYKDLYQKEKIKKQAQQSSAAGQVSQPEPDAGNNIVIQGSTAAPLPSTLINNQIIDNALQYDAKKQEPSQKQQQLNNGSNIDISSLKQKNNKIFLNKAIKEEELEYLASQDYDQQSQSSQSNLMKYTDQEISNSAQASLIQNQNVFQQTTQSKNKEREDQVKQIMLQESLKSQMTEIDNKYQLLLKEKEQQLNAQLQAYKEQKQQQINIEEEMLGKKKQMFNNEQHKQDMIRQQMEQEFALQLDSVKAEHQRQLEEFTINLKQLTEMKQAEYVKQLEQEMEEKARQLEMEVAALEQNRVQEELQIKITEQENKNQEILRQLEESAIEEQQATIARMNEATEKLVAAERQSFQKDLESFQKIWDAEFEISKMSPIEEQTYKATVQLEYDKKLKEFKQELFQELERKKNDLRDQIFQEEKAIMDQTRLQKEQEADRETEQRMVQLLSQQEENEKNQEQEIKLLEQKYKSEFIDYKNTYIKNLEEQLARLELEKQTKLKKLLNDEPALTSIDKVESELRARIEQMQCSMQQVSNEYKEKNQELTNLALNIENLKRQKQELESQITKVQKDITLKEEQTVGQSQINNKIEEVKKQIQAYDDQIIQLKLSQRTANFVNPDSSANSNAVEGDTNITGQQPKPLLPQAATDNNTIELEKIQKDLEDLKNIIKTNQDEEQEEGNNAEEDKQFNNYHLIDSSDDRFNSKEQSFHNRSSSSIQQYQDQTHAPLNANKIQSEIFQLQRQKEQLIRDKQSFIQQYQNKTLEDDPLFSNISQVLDEKIQKISKKIFYLQSQQKVSAVHQKQRTNSDLKYGRVQRTLSVDNPTNQKPDIETGVEQYQKEGYTKII